MTKVKVCDAIMGSGKSSAAINYMKNTDQKFIYITPYLDEVDRIIAFCQAGRFQQPQESGGRNKTEDTFRLIKQGSCIATTHQAFKRYTTEMLEEISRQEYTLIIDENVNVLEGVEKKAADVEILLRSGYLQETEPGTYRLVNDNYDGKVFKDELDIAKTRSLVRISNGSNDRNKDVFFYWQLPEDLIMSFKEVFILTYRFEGQSLYHFLKMHKIPFEYIGVKKVDGEFMFSDTLEYVPDYVHHLSEMIEIVEDRDKLNDIGRSKTALSNSWFKRASHDEKKRLKNNVENFFKHRCGEVGYKERMWSTYLDTSAKAKISGKGYARRFVSCNERATNKYKDVLALAYCVNLYMNVGQKLFYQNNGLDVNEDEYALSTMVQWIWRSAIRDGRKIVLYIPSSRMRKLLKNWIKEVSQL